MSWIKELKKSLLCYLGIIILAFILIAGFSIRSIDMIRGAARVIHYTGFIGGATQMVVKEEINGQENDSLIQLIDEMVPMLITGEGNYNVPILKDDVYQGHMERVQTEWEKIKAEIYAVREGESSSVLYSYSENTYEDTNLAAYAAQAYMENCVKEIKTTMYLVYIIFVISLIVFLYTALKNTKLESKAESLNQMAYYDPYIGIANKAYCEKKLELYGERSYSGDLSLLMFDLNNLKKVNDQYGHQAGDDMIRSFALALDTVGREYGFVGRFGGDEFIAIFENCNEELCKEFMKKLVVLIHKTNTQAMNPWEKVSCAAGYAVGHEGNKDIQVLLKEADDHMYRVKRKMKEKIKS